MFDINFYREFHSIENNFRGVQNRRVRANTLDFLRSKKPTIYNIETTNACPMSCHFCPRTTKMTRKVETMSLKLFERIINQIKPWNWRQWIKWVNFVEDYYKIKEDEMSENHFYLYIIPKVLQLHGYGEPLIDPHIVERVQMLADRKIPSYFSCNPAVIDVEKCKKLFEAGLDYIKFSIESTDDAEHKEIRGKFSNFTESYEKIKELLKFKKSRRLGTVIVITMLDIDDNAQSRYEKLKEYFKDLDVYIYFKSQDQNWFEDKEVKTNSIHWSEYCHHPWSSMTIKSNGEVAMCMEDFNNEIILGDAKKETLTDIWNGEKYKEFRKSHFYKSKALKCHKECDMKIFWNLQ